MHFSHILEAAMAAVLQGITEFFPVSSSGHLALFHAFFPDNRLGFAFDVFLNFGTCLSIVFYYHKQIYQLVVGFLSETLSFIGHFFSRFNHSRPVIKRDPLAEEKKLSLNDFLNYHDIRYGLMLVLSILPVGVIGVLAESHMGLLDKDKGVLAIGFLITAGILILCQKMEEGIKDVVEIPFFSILLVGFAEVFAILPGVSRMGVLLLSLLFLGVSRQNAIKFIFFSALPIGLGSTLLEVLKLEGTGYLNVINLGSMFLAFVVGLLSLSVLNAFLDRLRFSFLSGYVFLMGLITWFWMR